MIWWLRTLGRTVISDKEKLNAHFFLFVVLLLFCFVFWLFVVCYFFNYTKKKDSIARRRGRIMDFIIY